MLNPPDWPLSALHMIIFLLLRENHADISLKTIQQRFCILKKKKYWSLTDSKPNHNLIYLV